MMSVVSIKSSTKLKHAEVSFHDKDRKMEPIEKSTFAFPFVAGWLKDHLLVSVE